MIFMPGHRGMPVLMSSLSVAVMDAKASGKFIMSNRRIACLWLPQLAMERVTRYQKTASHRKQDGHKAKDRQERLEALANGDPFGLIKTDAHGMTIVAINIAARESGLTVGMRLNDARAVCHQLAVVEHEPEQDLEELGKIASWLERYSPSVQVYGCHNVLVDIAGCDHLFGGEKAMLADMARRLAAIGYYTRLGLADTIGAAFALAHGAETQISIAEPGQTHQGLAFLPVSVLRLEDGQAKALYGLGLKTIGQLYDIPRASVARRFKAIKNGASVLKRLDQALGLVGEPLEPIRPVAPLQFSIIQAEPCLHHEGIKAVFGVLLSRLLEGLEKRDQGARHISFQCFYGDGGSTVVSAGLARASRVKKHIESLFFDQLLTIDPRFGIDGFVLSADLTASLGAQQNGLLDDGGQAAQGKLSELIDRLVNRFGTGAVFVVGEHESHLPEKAQRRLAVATKPGVWQRQVRRPITVFSRPEAVEVIAEIPEGPPMQFRWRRVLRQVVRARGPERIAPEWWSDYSGHQQVRDYYEVEDSRGQRFWLFRAGHYGQAGSGPVWKIHGLFL